MALTEVIAANPKLSLGIIAFVVTLFSTMIHKWMTDQEHIKNLKARQKELQKEIRKNKDHKRSLELQQDLAKLSLVMMKSSMRPLFITLLPLLILFAWLRGAYADVLSGWIWWYIGFSIGFSIIIRRILKIH